MLVLHGPPAAGKSTLVKQLHIYGVRAIDLELYDPRDREWAAANWHRGSMPAVISGGGLTIHDFPKRDDIRHVLLLPPRVVYDARRAQRDAGQPFKASQPDVYHNFVAAQRYFDAVSHAVGSIGDVLDDLNRIHRMFFKRDIDGY